MKRKMISAWLLASAVLVLLAGPVAADETLTQTREESVSLDGVDRVRIDNLAGKVTLTAASGSQLQVKAVMSATGDDAEEASKYLAMLDLKVERDGDDVEVIAVYPVDDYSRFSYSEGGWGFNTTTRYMGERVSISSGRGLRVHMDFELAVPAGARLDFTNKVGRITASGVDAELRLDTSSGSIQVSDGRGRLLADTGSGAVKVSDHKGRVIADTGSGSVEFSNIDGDASGDTGSGSIEMERIKGNVRADTGSGSVDLADITGNVWVDTGSGGVDGVRLQGVEELEIDTGSGSVELDGDFSGLRKMRIDTGSGGVRMRTKGTLNMDLEVSAGSGGVEVDLPQMANVKSRRGEFRADIGNGEGSGVIDTGSGGVRISSQ